MTVCENLPEWLEEFTDNLEDTEMGGPAHICQDSDSERLTKVASRKHRVSTHFPKDPNCEIRKKTRITGLFADALAKQYFEQKSLVF